MSETQSEERPQSTYHCQKCEDTGILLDMNDYCDCAAGIAAEEEDRGSD